MFYQMKQQEEENMENRVEEIFSDDEKITQDSTMPPELQPTVAQEARAPAEPTSTTTSSSSSPEGSTPAATAAAAGGNEGNTEGDEKMQECLRLKAAGNALFSKGEVAEALAVYREAIALAPHKPYPKNPATNLSFPEESAPDTTTAEEKPSKAENQESTPQQEEVKDQVDYTCTAQLYGNAGLCLMKLDQPQDAIETLSEAIRHDPAYQKALLRRAECYFLIEKYPSAYADYETYEKCGGVLDGVSKQRQAQAKAKQDEEMQKMLGDLKKLGNQCLGWFGLSTDNFKFDKDPNTGSYSMRFER